MNTDSGGGEKLFAQWTVVKSSVFLMNHNKHQIMNNQGFNVDTSGEDRLFAQQTVVDPCDFLMAQYWKHQILSHQDVNINSSSAYELLPHQNDVHPTNDLNQHQYMSHQGDYTDISSLDELFA